MSEGKALGLELASLEHELLLEGFGRVFEELSCAEQDTAQGIVDTEVPFVGGMDARLQRCTAGVLWVASFNKPTRPDRQIMLGYTETAGHELRELRQLSDVPLPRSSYANIAWAVLATDWHRVPANSQQAVA
jgi:hypothetical protein